MSAVRNACVITTALMSFLLLSGCRRAASPAGKYEINAAAGKVMSAVLTDQQNERALERHDGSVIVDGGGIPGIWRYKDASKQSILLYSWLSGSTFTLQYEIVRKSGKLSLLDAKGKPAGTIKKQE